jgi:hypothetical protein
MAWALNDELYTRVVELASSQWGTGFTVSFLTTRLPKKPLNPCLEAERPHSFSTTGSRHEPRGPMTSAVAITSPPCLTARNRKGGHQKGFRVWLLTHGNISRVR